MPWGRSAYDTLLYFFVHFLIDTTCTRTGLWMWKSLVRLTSLSHLLKARPDPTSIIPGPIMPPSYPVLRPHSLSYQPTITHHPPQKAM